MRSINRTMNGISKMIGVGLVVFLLAGAPASEAIYADSSAKLTIPGFPIPLHWGMTQKEIQAVVRDNGLHLAVLDAKNLAERKFHDGKYYEWAAFKEKQDWFFPRFVVLGLSESDTLVYIRGEWKLDNWYAQFELDRMFGENFGEVYREDNNKTSTVDAVSKAWKIKNNVIVENTIFQMKSTGNKVQSYIVMHWGG